MAISGLPSYSTVTAMRRPSGAHRPPRLSPRSDESLVQLPRGRTSENRSGLPLRYEVSTRARPSGVQDGDRLSVFSLVTRRTPSPLPPITYTSLKRPPPAHS